MIQQDSLWLRNIQAITAKLHTLPMIFQKAHPAMLQQHGFKNAIPIMKSTVIRMQNRFV
jgi:hypothetical protein